MRFGISTFTSRRNSHAEIDQSLPHPAIRLSGSVNLIVLLLLGHSGNAKGRGEIASTKKASIPLTQ